MALERPPRRVPVLGVVLAVIVVATVVGLVWLWPPAVTGDAGSGDAGVSGPAGELAFLDATIVSIEPLPDDPTAGPQATVTITVDDGEALAGRTEAIPTQLQGLPDLAVGDGVVVGRAGAEGDTLYLVDMQRSSPLGWLVALFVVVVLLVGRWHGLRSLLGLGVSLFLVVRFVVPAILAGSPPALVALVGAVAVMLATLYLTHGVSARTTAAVVGTTVALAVTIGLGHLFLDWGSITGFASEEARFARVVVDDLDVAGLVLAGLIIAALGVLDDVTVAQASTVWALHDTDPRLGSIQVFRRAMAVGRDHIASTVNTLFLAYAGASLSLLVLFSTTGRPLGEVVTSEVVATELVKTLVGSLGLIAAVPVTTALAATLVTRRPEHEVVASRARRGGSRPPAADDVSPDPGDDSPGGTPGGSRGDPSSGSATPLR